MGVYTGTFTLENTFALSTKVEDLYSLCVCNPTPRYIANRNVYLCTSRDIYMNIHRNTICNIPILETHEKSRKSRMDKEIVAFSCNKILYDSE